MKKNLREDLLKKRDRISPEAKKEKEAAIRKRLYTAADFRRGKGILFYASFRSEVGTTACMENALKLQKTVALPRVIKNEKRLRLYGLKSLSDLDPGAWGILEPNPEKCREVDLDDMEVVIVPGAGFDAEGNRLGYGAGYYDKLLSSSKKNIIKIALAFEEQIVPKIPGEEHDVKMDKIITEKRTIVCRKRRLTTETRRHRV